MGLRLEGISCNRDAIGARLSWSVRAGSRCPRLKISGGSYFSSHDPREVIGGRAPAAKLDWLEIRWPAPSSRVERLESVPSDRDARVVEGKGIVG